mmetsp:Transcript_4686/g.5607  ORF Transcript_4686/g.5607 Transcript_4686/m.5607 type:complete len:190 (+) Transcript_4686:1193-1762(+)
MSIKKQSSILQRTVSKPSSDKLSQGSGPTTSHKRKRFKMSTKIDMKDPYIQKRTHLNIKQAKLMGNLAKNKISRDRFVYMLGFVSSNREREHINNLLMPKRLMRADSKMSVNFLDQYTIDQDEKDAVDFSNEVKKVILEYGELQKVHVKRKTTSINVAKVMQEPSEQNLAASKRAKYSKRMTTQLGSFL